MHGYGVMPFLLQEAFFLHEVIILLKKYSKVDGFILELFEIGVDPEPQYFFGYHVKTGRGSYITKIYRKDKKLMIGL